MGDNNVGQGWRIRSVLVANRFEIAIRVMRAAVLILIPLKIFLLKGKTWIY